MGLRFLLILLATWLTSCAEEEGTSSIPATVTIDSLVVMKSERLMIAYAQHIKIRSYSIALGKNPVGKKQFEGDYKTPEGLYYIDDKSAASKFHKNLNISYPNDADERFAMQCGKKCGGDIKIHGLPASCNEKNYRRTDWTWGCIGLTNSEIDELYDHIQLGSPILILP